MYPHSLDPKLACLGLLAILANADASSTSGYSCLDEKGNSVDWFVAFTYKETYYYMDSNTKSGSFVKSDYLLSQTTEGSIMKTTDIVYSSLDSTKTNLTGESLLVKEQAKGSEAK